MSPAPASIARYRIERLIAHGGMGSLYLARDPAIDRLVAIKLLKEGFDDDAARERFAHEARLAGRLHHPNIVTIFDFGEHDHRPFIAMEFVAGDTVAQLIRTRAFVHVCDKLALLEELCTGLHYAHTAGVVHRDIKPANVMRDNTGVIKILDFGIARAGAVSITRAGDVVGTLNYMSPEQLLGEPVDHRTDIYSVGVFAYELITHQMAFPGTVDTGVLSKILRADRVPIAALIPGIDPEIASVMDRAMMRDPELRHPDLLRLRDDLAAIRVRLLETAPLDQPVDPEAETRVQSARITAAAPSHASSATPSSRRREASAMTTPDADRASTPHQRAGRWKRLTMGSAALAAVVVAAILTINGPSVPNPAVPAPPASGPERSEPPPAPDAATVPAPAPAPPEAAKRVPPDPSPVEAELRGLRALARKQLAGGQRQSALDTLMRGLALDAGDAELNDLVDQLSRAARRSAEQARTAATRRGIGAAQSNEFRDGERHERNADGLLRAGNRRDAIRTLWQAAAAYDKAQVAAAAPSATAAAPPASAPANQPAATPVPEPSVPPTAPALPPIVSKKPVPAPSTPPVKPEPPPAVTRDPVVDSRDADIAGVRAALRRYSDAYESRDADAVGRVLPSLTPDQLRQLRRDFANYRSYTAQIDNEQIVVNGARATVTCDVRRQFETSTGVGGNNTTPTIFHLARDGSTWTIERIESR